MLAINPGSAKLMPAGLWTPPGTPCSRPRVVAPPVCVKRLLGTGGHSKVLLVELHGIPAALKVVDVRDPAATHEVNVMRRLGQHPHTNVLRTVAPHFHHGSSSLCLPLELCSGDVMQAVERAGPTGLPALDFARYFQQAVAGLVHCHRSGVFHLDVKPDNMLVGLDGCLKIGDFGCAAVVPSTPSCSSWFFSCAVSCGVTAMKAPIHSTTRVCGTAVYAAPEALACRDAVAATKPGPAGSGSGSATTPSEGTVAYDAGKADVWSLGVSMVVVATGFFPWNEAHRRDARYRYWRRAWESREDCTPAARMDRLVGALRVVAVGDCGRTLSDSLLRLLVRMLSPSPGERASMEEVLGDDWALAAGECPEEAVYGSGSTGSACSSGTCTPAGGDGDQPTSAPPGAPSSVETVDLEVDVVEVEVDVVESKAVRGPCKGALMTPGMGPVVVGRAAGPSRSQDCA